MAWKNHFGRDLILIEAGTHHFHGFELRVEGKIDSLAYE